MARTLVIAAIVVTMLGRSAAADADEKRQWRTAFFASLALTVGTGAFWAVSYGSMQSEASQIEATKSDGTTITQDDCSDRAGVLDDEGGHFASACTWRSRSRTGSAFTLGFALVTGFAAYYAFVDHGDDPPRGSTIAVTPTVSRDGAGAALQVRW